ncbi:MAG TPA: NAD-dependent epimerase/dehydratase family protein [Cyclobacteriaceae bacterium]|nr:NAD-dependent epimerase/dehydratase family protein [Cyclobacteriaceae bacterium]
MKVIITGATGMIGEGVLLECLAHPQISEVLSVSRKPSNVSHPKLKEYLVADFLSLKENDDRLKGFDACFFCAGVSSVGMNEEEYTLITYDTTLHFARAVNPNPRMSFIYVSGGGTDNTEKGPMMWARVKGKTENDLMKLPFKQVFGFRIGFVIALPGQKRVLKYYKYISWLTPLIKMVVPNMITSMSQVGLAMIHAARKSYDKNVIYVKDIKRMAEREMSQNRDR